jgi:myosin heavy subunit
MANEDVLDQICHLLRVKKAALSNSLTCYPIRIGSETLTKYFNCREVQ